MSFRLFDYERMKQQLKNLGPHLLYAVVLRTNTGPNIVKGYLHISSTFMKAREGICSKWKEVLPFLLEAKLESAAAKRSDREMKTFMSNDSVVLLEMGSSENAPNKDDHFAALATCTNLREVLEMDPELYIRCFSQLQAITRFNMLDQNQGILVTQLSRWQWEVHRRLLEQSNRKILFVVDSVGNRGKTYLSLYMDQRYGDTHLSLAEMKQHDMAYIATRQLQLRTIIFDYSRNWKPEFFAWTLFEQLKNGRVLSGKYESVVAKFPGSVKVAVFTNHDPSPEFHRLSEDRIAVINLDDEFAMHGSDLLTLSDEDPFP